MVAAVRTKPKAIKAHVNWHQTPTWLVALAGLELLLRVWGSAAVDIPMAACYRGTSLVRNSPPP